MLIGNVKMFKLRLLITNKEQNVFGFLSCQE